MPFSGALGICGAITYKSEDPWKLCPLVEELPLLLIIIGFINLGLSFIRTMITDHSSEKQVAVVMTVQITFNFAMWIYIISLVQPKYAQWTTEGDPSLQSYCSGAVLVPAMMYIIVQIIYYTISILFICGPICDGLQD